MYLSYSPVYICSEFLAVTFVIYIRLLPMSVFTQILQFVRQCSQVLVIEWIIFNVPLIDLLG